MPCQGIPPPIRTVLREGQCSTKEMFHPRHGFDLSSQHSIVRRSWLQLQDVQKSKSQDEVIASKPPIGWSGKVRGFWIFGGCILSSGKKVHRSEACWKRRVSERVSQNGLCDYIHIVYSLSRINLCYRRSSYITSANKT